MCWHIYFHKHTHTHIYTHTRCLSWQHHTLVALLWRAGRVLYEGPIRWLRYSLDREITIRETISSHYFSVYTTRLHCCYYLCIPLRGSVDRHPVSGEVGRHYLQLRLVDSVCFRCRRLLLLSWHSFCHTTNTNTNTIPFEIVNQRAAVFAVVESDFPSRLCSSFRLLLTL